jgi:dipeptidyl aminopeptidase/acylaminoacyl peptidase
MRCSPFSCALLSAAKAGKVGFPVVLLLVAAATAAQAPAGNRNVSSRVQAVVDWFGPTDFTLMTQQSGRRGPIQHDSPNSPESRLLGGPVQERRDLARTANPLTYVDRNAPPFLIMHGDNDQVVPLGQSVILARALIDAGAEVTMKTVHGADHEGPQFRSAESERLIGEFLARTLQTAR